MSSTINPRRSLAERVFVCGAILVIPCLFADVGDAVAVAQQVRVTTEQADAAKAGPRETTAEAADRTGPNELRTLSASEQAAALKRRGRANVLGMNLKEDANHRATVIEVTAASPAFDAGIREGDVILSFDGFAAKTYREWIDGIQRMVTDTPDGATVAVEVLRGGKRVVANVRTPESRVDYPLLPGLAAPLQPQQIGPDTGASPANQLPTATPGSGIFINNAPFNEAFDLELSPAIDRAMADIVRVGENRQQSSLAARGPNTANPSAAGTGSERSTALDLGQNNDAPAGPQGRIGIAGFRDGQDGMLVMVDVGGLEPGSYPVRIEDPAVMLGGENSGQESVNSLPDVSGTPAGASATPPTGQVNPPVTPPTGRVLPPGAPATGRVLPSGTTPTGLPATDETAGATGGPAGPVDPASGSPLNATLSQIGLLTVDESGTGRLQQMVEGLHVRDIVGQAIVIYAPSQPPEIALPADPTVSSARQPRTSTPGVGTTGAIDASDTEARPVADTRSVSGDKLQPNAKSSNMPVAAGMIRLMSDRRPSTSRQADAGRDSFPAPSQSSNDSLPSRQADSNASGSPSPSENR